MKENTNKWIAHGKITEESTYNMICIPYAGASGSMYAPWIREVDKSIAILPMIYPGREKRRKEEMPGTLQEIARQFVGESPEVFEKPYIVLGHCTGALTGYEIVKEVQKRHGKSASLFIAVSAPSPRKKLTAEKLRDFSDEDMLAYMIESKLVDEKAAGMSAFMNYYMPIFKQDFILHDEYECGEIEKMACNVICMYGKDDVLVDTDKISDWNNFTMGTFEQKAYAGDHFFIQNNVQEVLGYIKNAL